LDAPIEPLPDSVIDELTPYDFLGSMGGSASTSTAHPKDPKKLTKIGGMKGTDIDDEIKKLQQNKKELGKFFSVEAQQRLLDLIEERNRKKKAKAQVKNPGNKISRLPVVPYGESVSIGYMPSADVQIQNRYSADQDIGAKQQWMDNQAVLEAANKQKTMEYQYQGDAATTNAWGDFAMPVVNMMNSAGGGSSGMGSSQSSQNMISGTEAVTSSPTESATSHSLSIPSGGSTASSSTASSSSTPSEGSHTSSVSSSSHESSPTAYSIAPRSAPVTSSSQPASSSETGMIQVAPPTLTIQAGPSSY
ncbi:hypothetical protein IID04_05380, partial [PVC group bacterium]|nr:hypothetical protein [PVC group bacterium]